METIKCRAYIECNKQGEYFAYTNSGDLPFLVLGDGGTETEAKADFLAVYEAMRAEYQRCEGALIEVAFDFVQDASALLRQLPKGVSMQAVAQQAGISLRRLWQYKQAKRRPSNKLQEHLRTIVAHLKL